MLSDRGIPLTFVAPHVGNGVQVAKLDKRELEGMDQAWKFAIIFIVVGSKRVVESLQMLIRLAWSGIARPKVFVHEEGYFVV